MDISQAVISMPDIEQFPSNVDEVLRKTFEAALTNESPLRIADCLPDRDSPLYLGTLEEIIAIAIEHAMRQSANGRNFPYSKTLDQYLIEFPELKQAETLARLHAHCDSLSQLLSPLANLKPDTLNVQSDGTSLTLSNYRLLESIGCGGMGQVYRALHVRLQKFVAVKLLRSDLVKDEALLKRFEREMIASGQLQHLNIVTTFDAGYCDGHHYLVMELIDGANVESLLSQNTRFDIPVACEIARQAALGLDYAHGKGLVHRDIKPSNLMIANDGTVKLLDLGLACFTQSPNLPTNLTVSNQFLGTPLYMAPEQIDNPHQVKPSADIFGLGAVLHRMLMGKSPLGHHDASFLQVITKLARGDLELFEGTHNVPMELVEFIRTMLSIDPSNRPNSARLVASFLERYSRDVNLVRLLDSNSLSSNTTKRDFVEPIVPRKSNRSKYLLTYSVLTAVLVTLCVVWWKPSFVSQIFVNTERALRNEAKFDTTLQAIRWIRSMGGDGIAMSRDGTAHYLSELNPSRFSDDLRITRVELSKIQLTDGDLIKLSSLKSIVELSLTETNIDDDDLKHLSDLQELTFLNLVGTKINGEGFKYLTDLPQLCQMILSRTEVDDSGLLNLANMKVTQLTLDDTHVTDSSSEILSEMKSLKEINLSNLGFSETQLSQLRQKLPQCRITP
jgi:serine/threonine protein kinase